MVTSLTLATTPAGSGADAALGAAAAALDELDGVAAWATLKPVLSTVSKTMLTVRNKSGEVFRCVEVNFI